MRLGHRCADIGLSNVGWVSESSKSEQTRYAVKVGAAKRSVRFCVRIRTEVAFVSSNHFFKSYLDIMNRLNSSALSYIMQGHASEYVM